MSDETVMDRTARHDPTALHHPRPPTRRRAPRQRRFTLAAVAVLWLAAFFGTYTVAAWTEHDPTTPTTTSSSTTTTRTEATT